MPYWLARFLGRADGADVVRCRICDTHIPRAQARRVELAWVCSDECAEEQQAIRAW